MGVDVFLIIICIIFSCLSLVVGMYFVFTFQHPEDKWTSWYSKIIVTLALGVSTMNVLMLPLDAINRSSGNTLKLEIMCWVFTIASMVLAFVMIPFTITLYEGLDDEDCKHPVCRAFLILIPFLVFIVVLFLILWFAVGRCEIPITIQTATLVNLTSELSGMCNTCYERETTWNITPSAIVYCISLIGFIGYLLLLILGGCGIVTLPFNLIGSFINRPRPITLEKYTKASLSVNRWASELMYEGDILKKDVMKYGKNHKKVRKRLTRYEFQVESLEKTYSLIQIAYKLRGGNPIGYWFQLIMGIIGIILSIVWIVHIIVYFLLDYYPFLNTFFDIINNHFPYGAVIFYGIFVYYLYWCVLDGTASVGINILIIRVHPMEKKNTPMTSILFNSAVMLFASFGIALFCSMNFAIYARLTSLEMIYGVQMQTLAGLKYVWQYGTYVFLGFIVIGLIWKLATLKKRDKKIAIIKKSFKNYNTSNLNSKKDAALI